MTKQKQFPVKSVLSIAIASAALSGTANASLDELTTALSEGSAYGDFRLRYERVEQDNASGDANALTLRSRLGYKTGAYKGVSAVIEFEDSRVVAGQDDYDLPGPLRPAVYVSKGQSAIGDPETTELDQAFLLYKTDNLTAKLGRQVLTLDNHRFVGHVGWRQDRQTFDALTLNYKPIDGLDITYAYLDQSNRIAAEARDHGGDDHLLNVGYQTPFGKLSTYAYLLDYDAGELPGGVEGIDTYGVRLAGGKEIDAGKILYTAEFAYQEDTIGANTLEGTYSLIEGGFVTNGITTKLGYEVLGDMDGPGFANAVSTPLATLHKFSGWNDMFLGPAAYQNGLVDLYLSVSGKLAGGKWVVTYHDFSADGSTPNDDLGSEIDLLYAKKFSKNYSAGVKYGTYSVGNDTTNGKTDTDKLWLWLGAKF